LQRFLLAFALTWLWLGSGGNPAAAQLLTPQLKRDLQAEMDRVPVTFGVKGIAGGVRLPDGTIWTGAAGVSTESPLDSLRPDMLFGVASITKTFTAALIMRAVEQGYVQLDDSIGRHLPVWAQLPNINPAITIRQLLNHTSGLGEYTANGAFVSATMFTPGRLFTSTDLLAMIGPPVSSPGTQYIYSNTGYFLLGLIIEKVYRLPVAEAIRRSVWRPCGMTTTFMGYHDSIPAGLDQAHAWSCVTNPSTDTNLRPRTALFSGYNAAGGALSTVTDLAKWGRLLFSGNFISPASVREMQNITPQSLTVSLNPYGLGCTSFAFGQRTAWGHFGNITGCTSVFSYEPTCDVSIVLLFNDDRLPTLRPLIQERIYNLIQRAICPVPLGLPATATLSPPSLVPNPATNTTRLTFECPAETQSLTLNLLDATGRLVLSKALNPKLVLHDLSLTGLSAGVYHAQLQLTSKGTPRSTSARLVVLP
jgi:D-alanyl-D-alanine carboxypeptidase